MAQYQIRPLRRTLFYLVLIAVVVTISASGCGFVPASVASKKPVLLTPPDDPPIQVTFTPVILPTATVSPTDTASPTLPPSPTATQTPSPTPILTNTATLPVMPAINRLNYISLSNLDVLDRLVALSPISTDGPAKGFAFSQDKRWLALAAHAGIRLWDLGAGTEGPLLTADGSHFSGPLAFHPRGNRLAAVDASGRVRSWVLPAENSSAAEPTPGPDYAPAEVDQLTWVSYTVDGTRLVGLGAKNGQGVLVLWETTTGNRILQKPTGAPVTAGEATEPGALLVSPNGVWIVQAGQEGVLRYWAPSTGKSLGQQIIYACPDSLLGAAFSYDGSILAIACDGENHRIFLDAPNYFSPGDRRLAGVLEDVDPGPGLLAFNRDGALLAVAAGNPPRQVQMWDLINRYSPRSLGDLSADITQLAFSADGKWLAIGLADGTVELWGVSK